MLILLQLPSIIGLGSAINAVRAIDPESHGLESFDVVALISSSGAECHVRSRREFGPFVNQLVGLIYGLTIYINQSMYKLTSLYMNAEVLVNVIG